MTRTVVWFSCGAASACAAKIASKDDFVRVVYCDTLAEEHPDNLRFLRDVEKWIGQPIKIIRSAKYASVSDVFEQTRYMSGIKGARCTVEMKKVPRFAYQRPDDLHVFGLTADEQKRIDKFERNNPELNVSWVLKDWGLTKEDCYTMLRNEGIRAASHVFTRIQKQQLHRLREGHVGKILGECAQALSFHVHAAGRAESRDWCEIVSLQRRANFSG